MKDPYEIASNCPYCGAGRKPKWFGVWLCETVNCGPGDAPQQSIGCRLAVAEKDAARYRFIRDTMAVQSRTPRGENVSAWNFEDVCWFPGKTFDDGIDRLMEQQKAAGGGG